MVDRLEPETKKAKLESNLTADGASAGEPSSLMQEFWQSFKYSTVQQPYNGISQAVNYFGGNMPERKLVEAPQPRDFGSSEWMAQTAGGGISKLAGIMLLHKGISSVPGLGAGARSLTMTESTAMGRMSLGSLSVAGSFGSCTSTVTFFLNFTFFRLESPLAPIPSTSILSFLT